jgi:hypothetical protein
MLVNAPKSGGIVELNELLAKLAILRDVKFAIDRGNGPFSLLLARVRNSKRDKRLQSKGREPVS